MSSLAIRDASNFGADNAYFFIGLGLVLVIVVFLYILYRRRNAELGIPEGGDRVDQVLAETGQTQVERAASVKAQLGDADPREALLESHSGVQSGPFHQPHLKSETEVRSPVEPTPEEAPHTETDPAL